MLNRLRDGFERELTSSKRAQRGIDDPSEARIPTRDPAGGRSTGYALVAMT